MPHLLSPGTLSLPHSHPTPITLHLTCANKAQIPKATRRVWAVGGCLPGGRSFGRKLRRCPCLCVLQRLSGKRWQDLVERSWRLFPWAKWVHPLSGFSLTCQQWGGGVGVAWDDIGHGTFPSPSHFQLAVSSVLGEVWQRGGGQHSVYPHTLQCSSYCCPIW
jgi:hypothetical protein